MQKFQLGKEVSGKSGQKIAIISKWVRLADRFVAYQGSGNLGDSKAAHSSGSQKFWSVQSLSLSPDSGLGDTDLSYFDFH